ncbi:hypothetical protein TNCV_4878761 [Trichonephila clavipes]|nr:hypothetical protein TNCV_4878761 [Trichonephila clavipes]
MGSSFHTASSLCCASSHELTGEEWRANPSATHKQMFSMGDKSEDYAGQGNSRIPYVSRKIRTQSATCGIALSCWKKAHLVSFSTKYYLFLKDHTRKKQKLWGEKNLKNLNNKTKNISQVLKETHFLS